MKGISMGRSVLLPHLLQHLLILGCIVCVAKSQTMGELSGVHLRGCALLEFPYVKKSRFGHSSTQGYTGVAITYLESLRDHAGFSVTLSGWNGTFEEFVEHMGSCASVDGNSSNCLCDIGVGAFTMTNERVAKIDFLWPFANENHRMISRASDLQDDPHSNLSYMFNTFSWQVWLLIAVAVLVYAAGTAAFGDVAPVNRARYPACRPVLRARRRGGNSVGRDDGDSGREMKRARMVNGLQQQPVDHSISSVTVHLPPPGYPGTSREGIGRYNGRMDGYPNGADSDDMYEDDKEEEKENGACSSIMGRFFPRLQRLGVAMVYTFAMFIGHPQDTDASRVSSIHRISWRLLSITAGVFLFCLYNSSLTVLLFESVKESRFRTLEDVKECVVHPGSVTFIKGGASEALWNNAITQQKFCLTPHRPRIRAKSIEDGLRLLKERKADYFYSLEGAVLSVVHRRCDEFAVVGEPFFSSSIGFIVPKGSVYRETLSKSTRILREQDAFQSARTIAMRNACKDTSAATIQLSRLLFFFVAYFVTAFLLIAYRVYFICCANRSRNS